MEDNLRTVIVALVAAIPSTIAALSSLRNGRGIREAKKKLEEFERVQVPPPIGRVSAEKKQPAVDWYKAPDFDD